MKTGSSEAMNIFFSSVQFFLLLHSLACPRHSGLDVVSARSDETKMLRWDLEKQVVWGEVIDHLRVLLALLLHSSPDAKYDQPQTAVFKDASRRGDGLWSFCVLSFASGN